MTKLNLSKVVHLFEFTTAEQCAQIGYCNGLRPLIRSCRSQLTAEVHCWLRAAVLMAVWKTLGCSAQLLGPHHLSILEFFQDPAINPQLKLNQGFCLLGGRDDAAGPADRANLSMGSNSCRSKRKVKYP